MDLFSKCIEFIRNVWCFFFKPPPSFYRIIVWWWYHYHNRHRYHHHQQHYASFCVCGKQPSLVCSMTMDPRAHSIGMFKSWINSSMKSAGEQGHGLGHSQDHVTERLPWASTGSANRAMTLGIHRISKQGDDPTHSRINEKGRRLWTSKRSAKMRWPCASTRSANKTMVPEMHVSLYGGGHPIKILVSGNNNRTEGIQSKVS